MIQDGPVGRLFAAVPLPTKMVQALWSYAKTSERRLPGRYVQPENYHVTLAFLGNIPLANVESCLEEIIEDTARSFTQFKTDFQEPGHFGRSNNAILWAGMQQSEKLLPMAQMLREKLDAQDVPYDRKPMRPHITIARKVNLEGKDLDPLPHCEGTIDSIILYESTRRRGELVYVPLVQKYLR